MAITSARTAIRFLFANVSFAFGLWAVNISSFKSIADLDHQQLAWLFFMPPLVSFVAFYHAPRLSRLAGILPLISIGTTLFTLVFLVLSTNPPMPIIWLCFAAFGLSSAAFEVGLNTVANYLDQKGPPIMSSCHGFWSLGIMAGSFTGGMLGKVGVSFLIQELVFTPVVIFYAFFLVRNLPHPRAASVDGPNHSLPTWAILPISLIPVAALAVEGATMDWSAVFLSEDRRFDSFAVGSILASFMAGMAISRLTGDALRSRMTPKLLLIISILLAAIGMIIFAQATWVPTVTLAAIIAGIGLGNVYPVVLVLATANRSEDDTAQIVGSIAMVSFSALLLSPAIMGGLGAKFGLEIAFLLLVPTLLISLLWVRLAKI